jgi:hypothetical protein
VFLMLNYANQSDLHVGAERNWDNTLGEWCVSYAFGMLCQHFGCGKVCC